MKRKISQLTTLKSHNSMSALKLSLLLVLYLLKQILVHGFIAQIASLSDARFQSQKVVVASAASCSIIVAIRI